MNIIKIKHDREIPDNFTGIVEFIGGTKYWYKEGKLHRLDGPAVEYVNGDKHWYKEGKRHREDGPAIEYLNGTKKWYVEGLTHRIDGPAIEYPDGTKEWWIEGNEYCTAIIITEKIFLGIEKGKYDLEWLRFMTENEIEELPIIPGMPPYEFKIVKTITFDDLKMNKHGNY